MKTTYILFFFLVLSNALFAQCPSAGRDSTNTYCPNELFDVADLRSTDADTTGVFIDPAGDTMTTTEISLVFPGQYSFFYHVWDTSCPVDTAKYVIIILTNSACTWGLTESTSENNSLIKTNPVGDQLLLNDIPYDMLEVYEPSGRLVLSFSKDKSILDISQLQGGNYLLVHEKDGTRQFQRFLKY